MALPPTSPPSPWSLLPQDLSDLILAHLSTAEAARVKPVCRSWWACVNAPWFKDLQERVQGPRGPHLAPTLLLYNHAAKISAVSLATTLGGTAASSSTPTNAGADWADLRLPSPLVREWVGHPPSHSLCIRTHFETSCISPGHNSPTHQFIVGSPFSNRWAAIPNPPPISSAAVALSKLWAIVVTPSHHSSSSASASSLHDHAFWVLLLLLHNGGSLSLHIFDSEISQWSLNRIPAISTSGTSGRGGQLISFSSRAESIGEVIYAMNPESCSVVGFDVRRRVWKSNPWGLPRELIVEAAEITAKSSGGFVDSPARLIQGWKGRVLLVGATARPEATMATVWAREERSGRASDMECFWREIGRVPRGMAEMLAGEAAECRKLPAAMALRYSGHGDTMVVMAMGSSRALVFDVMTEKWEWLPLPANVNCDLALCFSGRPNIWA